jgi:hypothetical protein
MKHTKATGFKTAIIAAALLVLPCSARAMDCQLLGKGIQGMAEGRDSGTTEQQSLAIATAAGANDTALDLIKLIYTDQASMTPEQIYATDYEACVLTSRSSGQ